MFLNLEGKSISFRVVKSKDGYVIRLENKEDPSGEADGILMTRQQYAEFLVALSRGV